jgi:hypothetical protein
MRRDIRRVDRLYQEWMVGYQGGFSIQELDRRYGPRSRISQASLPETVEATPPAAGMNFAGATSGMQPQLLSDNWNVVSEQWSSEFQSS